MGFSIGNVSSRMVERLWSLINRKIVHFITERSVSECSSEQPRRDKVI